MLYRTRYTDLCYGYNAFWAHCLPHLHVDCDGFEVETLINVRLAKANLRVCEVASFEGRRLYGMSKLKTFRDGRRVLKTIVRERWRRDGAPLLAGLRGPDRGELLEARGLPNGSFAPVGDDYQ